ESLGGMFFVDACTGWVGGTGGVVLKTTDCGASWQRHNANFPADVTAVGFADAATGWAVGNDGAIRFTSDGGRTWVAQLSTGVSADSFATIWCVSPQRCWAGGDGSLVNGQNRSNFWTTTNGQTWRSEPVPMTAGTFAGPSLDAIRFVDAARGWMATEEGFILRTVNGGAQWSVEFSDPSRPWIHGLGMRTDGSGVAAGEQNAVYVRSAGR
ncbi:MAG: YCF48-related protein, partial [Dehalococcoidia bacterium]|nr:YCF48-related protein [Dehalococcoidia bacterium]